MDTFELVPIKIDGDISNDSKYAVHSKNIQLDILAECESEQN